MKRFWDKVRVTPGCWLWTAYQDKNGYGKFLLDGVSQLAHRVSWRLTNGEIPSELQVLHKCDVPACVNPDHLFLGDNTDNVADKMAKGRGISPVVLTGANHPGAKLTEARVLAIRGDPRTNMRIAVDYGVSTSYISRIKLRRRWKTVEEKRGGKSCER